MQQGPLNHICKGFNRMNIVIASRGGVSKCSFCNRMSSRLHGSVRTYGLKSSSREWFDDRLDMN